MPGIPVGVTIPRPSLHSRISDAASTSRGSNGNTNGSPSLLIGFAPRPLIFSVDRIPTIGSGNASPVGCIWIVSRSRRFAPA